MSSYEFSNSLKGEDILQGLTSLSHDSKTDLDRSSNEGHSREVITIGALLNLIREVLNSINDSVNKSAEVIRTFFKDNLKITEKAAQTKRDAQLTMASGMIIAATAAIVGGAVMVGASTAQAASISKHASKMNDIENTKIAAGAHPKSGSELHLDKSKQSNQLELTRINVDGRSTVASRPGDGVNQAANASPQQASAKSQRSLGDSAGNVDGKVRSNDTKGNKEHLKEQARSALEKQNQITTAIMWGLGQGAIPKVGEMAKAGEDKIAAFEQALADMFEASSRAIDAEKNIAQGYYSSLHGMFDTVAKTVDPIMNLVIAESNIR